MASKSMKNVLSVLALSSGISLKIKDDTKAATPTKYANSLDVACQSALDLWPGELTIKELSAIHDRLATFERQYVPDYGRPEFLTSIALGLIDGLEQVIRDPVKRSALDRVGKALNTVHGYYDRTGEKWEIYEAANVCIERWEG